MSTRIEHLPGGVAPAPRDAAADRRPTLVIQPAARFPGVNLRELWAYRGLFWFLVWRDIKVRYAQTLLGAGWAVLQPVLTALVFAVVFGRLARIPSDGVPYPLFALCALVPWTYFSTAFTGASGSLVSSTHLITKVYFPRLVIPMAPVLAALADLAVAMAILMAAVLAYGIVPSALALVLVPVCLLAMVLTAAGAGFWLAALNIQYRDVKYVLPFLLQVWMYVSPIVYPASLVPPAYRTLYALNPMVGVIEGFRAALLGTRGAPWALVGVSMAAGLALFVSGALYFRRTERVFADVA